MSEFICSSVLCKTVSTAICNPATFPDFIDLRQFLPSIILLPHPGDTLLNSYVFGCRGRITQWEAHTSGKGAHQIEFQVWRPTTEKLDHDLVGVNTFPNATPTDNMLRLSVPEGEQINVSPGDFVGIRTMASTEGDGFKIQAVTGTSIQYNLTAIGYSDTPDLLQLGVLDNPNCYSPSPRPIALGLTPIINAVVARKYSFDVVYGMLYTFCSLL